MARLAHRPFLCWIALACLAGRVAAQAPLPPQGALTRADQILKLTEEQAQNQHPVTLEATVTFSDPDWGLLFVQDATAGVCLEKLPAPLVVNPGDLLAIEGVTSAGYFSPVVVARTVKSLRRVALPAPQSIRAFDLHRRRARPMG
ncbi:MAG: hypothetical protein U1G07_19290 [Verrucomicrobiota bacterium]